jgi:hypothetical protein
VATRRRNREGPAERAVLGAQRTGLTSRTRRAVLAVLLVVVLIGLAVGIVRVESLRRREVEGRTGVERAVVLTPPVAMSPAQSLAGAGRYDEAIAVLQGAVRTGRTTKRCTTPWARR